MSKLDIIIKEINKKHKETIISKGIIKKESEKIPFSSPRANYMFYGGIPRGRLIEFAGEEQGGKTTTAIDIVANAQKLFKKEYDEYLQYFENKEKLTREEQSEFEELKIGSPKRILYADCENTFDEEWAKLIGVNVDDIILLKPMSQTAEQIFDAILDMIETGELGLVIIDSLGVMLSAQAYEKTMEEKTYGGISMALTLFSKKAEMLCAKTNCTIIGINQVRENMNSPYGGVITTGGRAWRHNCSIRVMFSKGAFIDERGNELKRSAENPQGNLVMMNIVKTKVFKPDRRVGFYTLKYYTGIDKIADTIDMAIEYGIINQAGSWFTFTDAGTGELLKKDEEILKIQGKQNVTEYLKADEQIYNYINEKVLSNTLGQ